MPEKTSRTQGNQEGSRAEAVPGKFAVGTVFLLVLAAVALHFCYVIARPFLTPIFLALMIAIVFHPIHLRIRKPHPAEEFGRSDLYNSGPCHCCCASGNTGSSRCPGGPRAVPPVEREKRRTGWLESLRDALRRSIRPDGRDTTLHLSALDLRGALVRWLEQISRNLLSWGTHFLSNIVSFFVEAIIAFFTLFFLFREGESLKLQLAAFLPLRADQFERLFTGISNSIVANVYGCWPWERRRGS